jgi:uncharacterized protein YceK
VTLPKFLLVLAVLALCFGVTSIFFMFRARAMRAFAARRGFQYIGPARAKWGFPSFPKIKLPLSVSVPPSWLPGRRNQKIWNVIEGLQNGVWVLIFDSVFGKGKGTYCTFVAFQSNQYPFGSDTRSDRVIHSGGWTALYRIPTLQVISWTMGIQRLDDHVNKLWAGSVSEPRC